MAQKTMFRTRPFITQEKVFRNLVVDDDPWNRTILRMEIENEGWQRLEAENGRTGLEKFKMQPVDVVISDQQAPDRLRIHCEITHIL